VNNQIYDRYVNNVWQTPYDIKDAFAFCLSNSSYSGLQQQFSMPEALWLTNNGANITGLQFDPGDGNGYRNLVPGQLVNVLYADTGFRDITFRAVVSGTTLYSQSRIHISLSLQERFPSTTVIPMTSTESFGGKTAKGKVTIRLANPQQGLRNPLIVIEGFDTGKITNPETIFGDTDYGRFIDDADESSDLTNLMLQSNYDIIYVDWDDGTDDIRRNALLVKDVIRYVNTRKAQSGSTSKNVVIGMSMGGLASRYALRKMEISNENHQVSLFVSYDTPHQGASVPIGFQHMANQLSSVLVKTGINNLNKIVSLFSATPNFKKMLGIVHSPAARQMLLQHVAANGNMDNSMHNSWQTELANLGYPQGFSSSPVRNVAISNGSSCAQYQDLDPNEPLLYYSGKANTTFLGDYVLKIVAPYLARLSLRGGWAILGLPGKNEIKFDLSVNATWEGLNNQVFYCNIVYTKKLLWLIPLRFTIAKDRRFAPNDVLWYERYAGGFYKTNIDLKDSSADTWFYKYNVTAKHQPLFGFVPVPSALDIGFGPDYQDKWMFQTKYKGAALEEYQTPFQNFITSAEANQSHLTITPLNGTWLRNEILGLSPQAIDCTIKCMTNNDLLGESSLFCTGSEY